MYDLNIPIPLANPAKENEPYQYELEQILKNVVTSGQYILGQQVSLFEKNFSNYCGAKHCVSTASGSDSLSLALKALGCKENDKIITVPNAGYYSTAAIRSIGAIPIYVDICEATMAMSTTDLETILTNSRDVKCIVVTHLYGAMFNVDKIAKLAAAHEVLLLEDCSQAHGAKYKGKSAGTFGDAGTYSFYPTKNLGAIGDGGAVVTNSQEVFRRLFRLRQYGWSEKYKVVLPNGQNSRLDEIQAAILNFKLMKLDSFNSKRKSIVKRYASVPLRNIKVFNIDEENFVAHLAIVKTKHRDELRQFLIDSGIGCDVHFPYLDYHQEVNFLKDVHCKNAEKVVNEILTVPCHTALSEVEISRVIGKLVEFDKKI